MSCATRGYSTPVFWIALKLLVLSASIIPLLPTQGMIDAAHGMGPFERTLVYKHTLPPLIIAVSLIGDGLNDALNPKLRERLWYDHII